MNTVRHGSSVGFGVEASGLRREAHELRAEARDLTTRAMRLEERERQGEPYPEAIDPTRSRSTIDEFIALNPRTDERRAQLEADYVAAMAADNEYAHSGDSI